MNDYTKYCKNKDYYLEKTIKLKTSQQKILNNQINLFYNVQKNNNCINNYKVGDKIKLKRNTLIHWIRAKDNFIKILKSIENYGLISNTFFSDKDNWKINYCVSLWHIKKDITLSNYIKLYSGMTIKTNLETNKLIAYGEFDNYIKSLQGKNFRYLFAQLSMENTFLPSLALNSKDNNLALIFSSEQNEYKQILNNNLLSDNIISEDITSFFNIKNYEMIEDKTNNEYDRIAYIPFGIPSAFIEGILVSKKIEKNAKLLADIKKIFPNCYIANLEGIVIY